VVSPSNGQFVVDGSGACRAVLTHERVRVRFDCEPAELIDALRRGVRPRPRAGEYEVVIDP